MATPGRMPQFEHKVVEETLPSLARLGRVEDPSPLSPWGKEIPNAKLPAAVSTPPSSPARKTLRFAVFEVDLTAGELRKHGTRIRLQEQPFQILVYLLDRAGEVVTREELRQQLWPANTFVDFDHSLNTAVNKLREALGDSASNPRYVETLARRGYRFLAPVQPAEAKSAAQDSPSVPPRQAAAPPAMRTASFHHDLEVPLPRRSLTRSLFGLVQLMYLIFYVNALFRLTTIDRITGTFFAGMGSARHLGHCAGDGRNGYPATLLPNLSRGVRSSGAGREISVDVPGHPGARPVVGRGSVSSRRKDRVWSGFCCHGCASVCAVFGENAGAIGLSLADRRTLTCLTILEPCSRNLRVTV